MTITQQTNKQTHVPKMNPDPLEMPAIHLPVVRLNYHLPRMRDPIQTWGRQTQEPNRNPEK